MKTALALKGILALVLGVVGVVLATVAAVASILFVVGANRAVDNIVERITTPIDRLERRVEEASASLDSADGAELAERASNLVDQAQSAQRGLEAISEHPLYARLPVDTSGLEADLGGVADRAEALDQLARQDTSAAAAGPIARELDDAAVLLDGIDGRVDKVADSLRLWIRLSGLVMVLLALWSLWAQLALAGHGISHLRRNKTTTT